MKAPWPNSAASKARRRSGESVPRAALISRCTYGWQRITPWPKMIRQRVMMFAPSTVMGDGHLLVRARQEVVRPHADALAADDVHGVVDHIAGTLGVTWYLAMAEMTDGFSPRSTASADSRRAASIK